MYLTFDIGGTKTRMAVSLDGTSLGDTAKFDTPQSFEEGISRFKEESARLLNGRALKAAAGGIRGPLTADKGTIASDTILTDWVLKPIKAELEKILGVPVFLENDTALVGLGEAVVGAGKGFDIVAYHTVSTGVGGARIVGRRIDKAHAGFEPGKQVVDIDHTLLPEHSKSGMLEDLISGAAMEARFGMKPYEVSQDDVIWDELATYLAYGLKNTVLYWSPDIIVLGGSMVIGDPRIMLKPIADKTKTLLEAHKIACPPIVDATLKDEGGLFGALALIQDRLG